MHIFIQRFKIGCTFAANRYKSRTVQNITFNPRTKLDLLTFLVAEMLGAFCPTFFFNYVLVKFCPHCVKQKKMYLSDDCTKCNSLCNTRPLGQYKSVDLHVMEMGSV
jgi:hypothetical protein